MAFTINTPHAAVKIWNYVDRITELGAIASQANEVKEEIISTLSLMSIQTSKRKGDPVGSFNFTLAPNRNWVSVITPGSWCVILMSNEPITKKAFEKADPAYVKMFGRIDTVRVEVSVDEDGTRSTRYLVSGEDWGSMFNNVLYVDPLIADPGNSRSQMGAPLYVDIVRHLLGRDNTPALFSIKENLQALLSVFGKSLATPTTTRIDKPTHTIIIPEKAVQYFNFIDGLGQKSLHTDLSKIVALQTGSLNSREGEYDTTIKDGNSWLDPFSLVGQHSLWSILMDNCNHALNELYPEFRWLNNQPQLTLYSRIKPFSFQKTPIEGIDTQLRALFKNVVTHQLNSTTISSVNAGTNWKDKFNFIEIKPDLTGFELHAKAVKLKSQAYQKGSNGAAATDVFDREGFKPLILSIKQIPIQVGAQTADKYDVELLNKWVNMLQEWFFDTHLLLNGTITMTGTSQYIPVGDNIMFDAGLIGVSANYNSAALEAPKCFVLGHVENIEHSFTVDADGARQFRTTIQFVRGVIVDENKTLIGGGTLDTLSTDLQHSDSLNRVTIVTAPTVDNPGSE
jgi:hypothetical protein